MANFSYWFLGWLLIDLFSDFGVHFSQWTPTAGRIEFAGALAISIVLAQRLSGKLFGIFRSS